MDTSNLKTEGDELMSDDTSPSTTLFASVPDVCWELIAQLASPPDVYNLCLTSKRFHTLPVVGELTLKTCNTCNTAQWYGMIANSNTCGGCEVVGNNNTSSSVQHPLLATRLLRESLLVSLGRVLNHLDTGITLESLCSLADLEDGSALIAGSSIVQACLGELWGGDVDVYTSAKAAPDVRSWLVEKANCLFVGFNDGYISADDDRLAYTVDTKIHHVESWGSLEKNVGENLEGIGRYGWGDKTVQDANKEGANISIDAVKNSDYYKKACGYGKVCQKNYVDWKWKNGMSFDTLLVDQNKAYNIKPKTGGQLPFDFDASGKIDLIVARRSKSPNDLLQDFDLTICKASFDGSKFHIPNPHQTFSRKSTMEPSRKAVVESYLTHFQPPGDGMSFSGMNCSAIAASTIRLVRRDVPNTSFYKQLDLAGRLPDYYNPNADMFGRGSMYDQRVQNKHSAPCMFHNWTRKLVLRLQKYQARGIEVIDTNDIAADYVFPQFSLTSM